MIIDNPIVSGSLNVQNSITANGITISSTASAAYFTGSFVGDGTQLSGVTSYTDADTLDYINSLGVLSGSNQIAADISGSITEFSASVASAIASISTDFADITNKPALISSSLQFNSFDNSFTGSFTGSFKGNGAGLTDITVSQINTVTASFAATSSVTILHSFNSKNVSVNVYDDSDILLIPQQVTLVDNNNVKIDFSGNTTGFAVIAKGGHIVSGSVVVPELSTVADSFTSASSHTVTHNFNTKNVIVSVYENDSLIIPDTVTTPSANSVSVSFPEAISGRVVVVKAGHIVTGSIPFDNLVDSPLSQGTLAVTSSKHIVPSQDQTYDLGSPSLRFRDLYLSSASIFLGNTVVSEDSVVTTGSLQSVLPGGTLSGSAQIASDISGSFTSVSASIASDLVSNYLRNTSDTLDGNLTVTGRITAQEFHTEFVSASILYESGSTQFGNSSDDTHVFTGNVGIGTDTPAGILDVRKNQNTTTNFFFRNTDTTDASSRAYLNLISGDTNLTLAAINGLDTYIAGTSGRKMYFQQNIGGTVNMLIDSNGNVGIGTANPLAKLDVIGDSYVRSGVFFADEIRPYTGNQLSILNGGTNFLYVNGNVGIGTNSPYSKLTVGDSTNARIEFTPTDTTTMVLEVLNAGRSASGTLKVYGQDQIFYSRNAPSAYAESMRITPTGNMGIGTNSPNTKFHVYSSGGGMEVNPGANTTVEFIDRGNTAAIVNTSFYTRGAGYFAFFNGGYTERMRIHTDGNIGIGTSSPTAKLHVNGIAAFGTTTTTQIGNAGSTPTDAGISYGMFHNTGIGLGIASGAGGGTQGIQFWNHNGSSYFKSVIITGGSGNVGIGSTTPQAKLDIAGGINVFNGANTGLVIDTDVLDVNTRDAIYLKEGDGQATGRQAISWYNYNQNYYKARLWTQVGSSYQATQFGIDVADNARTVATRFYILNGQAYTSGTLTQNASDERLKTNITPIPDALTKVLQLKGINFTWKDIVTDVGFYPGQKHDVGVLAQDVEKVLPEIVKPAPFDYSGEGSKSGENYKTVQYEKLTPLLIEAIKELNSEVQSLKAEIQLLKNQ